MSTISIAGGGAPPTAFARQPGPASSIAHASSGAMTISSCPIGTATRSPAKPSPSTCPTSPGIISKLPAARGALGPSSPTTRKKLADSETTLFVRPKGQEITYHQFDSPITGQKIRFVNVEQEQPIGELSAYYVHPGMEPTGVATLRYKLTGQDQPRRQSINQTARRLHCRPLSGR